MSNEPTVAPSLRARLNNLTRRDLLGFAAKGAASVVVSQGLLGACASGGDITAATTTTTDTGGTVSGSTGTTSASCIQTAALTEGPYFIDEKLLRSDIRSDPVTGVVSAGLPLSLTFNVSRVDNAACTPLTGAYLDVWHCDAGGTYSDVSGNGNGAGGAGKKFLRGYQITDATGKAAFQTIYPGWYSGRAVHIHFKLRLFAGATKTYEFTSQFFMDEALTSIVHAQSPYNAKGTRNVLNTTDGIYNGLSAAEKVALTLQTSKTSDGYAGVINLAVKVG
jgi:protocatechuate 3,4-dioxygenase beta subunit